MLWYKKIDTSHTDSSKDCSTMVESVPRNVELLLEGKPYEELHEFCDFSLQDQNDASLAKGIQPSAPSEFKPVIKKSVTYIVAAVLFNSEGEVLMMQVNQSQTHLRSIYSPYKMI